MWWFRRARFAFVCGLSLLQIVSGTVMLLGACHFSVVAGELFGELALVLVFAGIMCSPAITLIMIVLIHDHIVKKREKKIAKTEEERQRQQEEIKMLNVKIAETLRNSKKEKIIIKEK